MTRWARANNIHKHKPAEATPWSQLRAGAGAGGGGGGGGGDPSSSGGSAGAKQGPHKDNLRRTQPGGSAVKKPNRKKKDYDNEDVNGFLEYLQQTGQSLPKGERGGREEEREVREELETALKKDQRRENRRIKRQKDKKDKMLCFHCRKPGHGLADCPEADRDEEMGRGICYRCGSTEHEIQKCRAKVDPALGDYPHAKCFICGQTGHLSRSCPDNPKGLYAQGGCCRVCGSVEHFQKDCPEHQAATQTQQSLSSVLMGPTQTFHVLLDHCKRQLAENDSMSSWLQFACRTCARTPSVKTSSSTLCLIFHFCPSSQLVEGFVVVQQHERRPRGRSCSSEESQSQTAQSGDVLTRRPCSGSASGSSTSTSTHLSAASHVNGLISCDVLFDSLCV